MHTQGAEILAIHIDGDHEAAKLCRYSVAVPPVDEFLLPILEVVPLQMLAYFIAVQRGVNVDAPRNLVKAVVRE
jgi:glucosamine--fructose-6-phosphate aminotransferase (isomerizing)